MKKCILLAVLTICTINCKSYRDFISIEINNPQGTNDSLIDGIYVLTNINDHVLKLKFDSGATLSTLNSLDLIGGKNVLNDENYSRLLTIEDAQGKKTSLLRFKTNNIETNTSKSINQKVIIYDKELISDCNDIDLDDGLLGLNAFSSSKLPISLNYKDNKIEVLNNLDLTKDYIKVNAKFGFNKIEIVSLINGKKTDVIFDTGNNGFIVLSKNYFKENPDLEVESIVITANNTINPSTQKMYFDKKIDVGGINIEEGLIGVNTTFKKDGIGLQFINKFNWIIDFENKKLYAKQIKKINSNKEVLLNQINEFQYKAMAFNNNLLIAYKRDSISRYNIGDKIVSINDELITESNICDKKNHLNSLRDWSLLNIKTIEN